MYILKKSPLAQCMICLTNIATISVDQSLLLYLKYRIWCEHILVTYRNILKCVAGFAFSFLKIRWHIVMVFFFKKNEHQRGAKRRLFQKS